MTGPFLRWTTRAKKAAPAGAELETRGLVELSTVPSTFALITPRGRTMLLGAPNGKVFPCDFSNWPAAVLDPVGFGSTEAEKTELVTSPAIRTRILPPFCACGSGSTVTELVVRLVIDGGGVPKKAPLPPVKALVAGTLA